MKQTDIADIDLDALMQTKREKLLNDRATKQQELEDINGQLRRIEGYLNPAGPPPVSKPRAPSTGRATRGEMGGVQKLIVDCVTNYQPDGVKAKTINSDLRDSGYNTKQIAAALTRMKKNRILDQEKAQGPYTLGPNAPRPATTPTEEEPAEAEVA